MPELPEIETIRQGLEERIVGLTIKEVVFNTPKMLLPDPESLISGIKGAKVIQVGRRAKMPLLFLDNGKILVFHLKLNGQLLVRKVSKTKDRFVRVSFVFDNGEELRFAEMRKFGWAKLLKNEAELEEVTARLGPEPFSKEFNFGYFQEKLSRSRRAIKIVLMDQKEFAGIGNIYATEALFYAGIDPRRPANSLSEDESDRLYQKVLWVLKQGLKYQGTTDRDLAYLQVSGEPGRFQEHLAVYGREGKPCLRCGEPIRKIKISGRGTYFCSQCQK
jgi:formamidopyrimidine-DNA glycosylase